MRPVLSIITVCYNSEKTIQRTFDSIRDLKSLTDLVEYIVVDGNSTDSTLELIKKNSSIIDRSISERDEGIYDGMNKGADLASGEYLLYINSDDWVDSDELTQILNDLQNRNLDFAAYSVKIVNQAGEVIGERKPNLKQITFSQPKGMPCSHQGFIIKKKLFQGLGGYSLNYKIAGDYELILKALSLSSKFENFSNAIAFYSLGGASYGNRAKKENFKLQKKFFSLPYAIIFYLKEIVSVYSQMFLPNWLVIKIKKIKGSEFDYIQQK